MTISRLLLTGSTGFVGRAVTRQLRGLGIPLRHVVRAGSDGRIDGMGAADQVVECADLFDQSQDWWAQTCAGCDGVLHLAWYAEPGQYQLSARNFDCLSGSLTMARGAIAAGVERFVGVGTCLEYDLSPGAVAADAPLAPRSPYAAAKAACGLALGHMLPLAGVSFLWARLFYLYGAGEDPRRLIAYLHRQLAAGNSVELSAGDQVRDFLDVDMAAELLVRELLGTRQGAVNISSGTGTTVRQLAETIADTYGRRDLLRFGVRPASPDDPPVVIGLRPPDDSTPARSPISHPIPA